VEKLLMHVLITGGAGFLGRHIVAAARQAGHHVSAPRSTHLNLASGEGVRGTMYQLQEEHGPVDVLIHSAAYYGGIGINQAEPATIFARNAQMAINAFELAREYEIPKILPIGSACAYPGYLEGDLVESEFWNGPLHASVAAYGFSKKMQLVAQHAYHQQHGLNSNHLILTNLYGPHDVFTEYRSHVVSALIKKFADAQQSGATVTLWGDGSPIREFLYVEDAAEAVVRAIPLDHDPEPINIGTGVGTSIRELAELIAAKVGYDRAIDWDPTKPNGAERKVLDITRLKQTLNWTPPTNLDAGLTQTIDWYLENKPEADLRH
jgi:GDP-L-fucose synthase